MSASGGVCAPSSVVPTAALKFALRGAQHHHRPGDHQLLGGGVDDGLKRWGSMGFSADAFGAEPVAVVVAEDESAVVGSVVDEQLDDQ